MEAVTPHEIVRIRAGPKLSKVSFPVPREFAELRHRVLHETLHETVA
jgi:hypothetical protein